MKNKSPTSVDFVPYVEHPPQKKTCWEIRIGKIRSLPTNWYVIHHSTKKNTAVSTVSMLKRTFTDFKFEYAKAVDQDFYKIYALRIEKTKNENEIED